MRLRCIEYEIPLLQALIRLGGSAKTSDVYPVVEEIMKARFDKYPEEYEIRAGEPIWKNQTRFARNRLKEKGQFATSEKGIWKVSQSGRERVRVFEETDRDFVKLHGYSKEAHEEKVTKESKSGTAGLRLHEKIAPGQDDREKPHVALSRQRKDQFKETRANNKKTLGEVLKELRKTLGLTQEEFGAAIGTTQELVAKLESNRHKPSYNTLQKIINTFKVNPKIFFPS